MKEASAQRSQVRRTALVTGGARRLGRHIALALADAGYDVVITYNTSRGDAQRTVAELKERKSHSIAIGANVSNSADVRRVITRVKNTYSRLDVFIGNAGVFPPATPMESLSESVFDSVLATNLKGNFLFGQAASALMQLNKTKGVIVLMASLGGLQIWKDEIAYNVSKAGLITLTRAMARALAPYNITVNAIAPGHIEMPDEPGAVPLFGAERVPMQRFGTPDDICRAVMFFVQTATYITGEVLAVDGGRHLLG